MVDAPHDLLSATDFAPFRALADMPAAMTAHVVFAALDPDAPATTSPAVIVAIVRGEIGFDGLLVSDDLSMAALDGAVGARAAAALGAGCDVVLHCNGEMAEMTAVAAACAPLSAAAALRAGRALARPGDPLPCDACEVDAVRLAAYLEQESRHAV